MFYNKEKMITVVNAKSINQNETFIHTFIHSFTQ